MDKKATAMAETRPPNKNKSQEISTGNQILCVLMLVAEILFVWVKMTAEIFITIYRMFIAAPEKAITGEIALITGAGHGIGKELALQYAAEGVTVVCWDINKKNNDQTVKEIAENGYTKAYSFECDISNRETVLNSAKKVKTEVGNVTIVVNNAGIMPTHSMLEHSEEEIRAIFNINVFAHYWILEAFLPAMLEKNHGHIIALSSMAGILGLKNLVPYCASKFAVRGMMEAMHEELRETVSNTNIKFTSVYPYMVDTGLCKRPKIRFPSLLSIIPPKVVASKVINAARRNVREISIPEYMFPLNNMMRLFPARCSLILKDFLDSGLESDL